MIEHFLATCSFFARFFLGAEVVGILEMGQKGKGNFNW